MINSYTDLLLKKLSGFIEKNKEDCPSVYNDSYDTPKTLRLFGRQTHNKFNLYVLYYKTK